MAYEVTDEIFGIAVSVPEKLHPAYMYGAVAVAGPGWVLGTFLGAVIGMILPERVMSSPECSSLWDVHGSCDSALQEKQGNCRSSSCFYDLQYYVFYHTGNSRNIVRLSDDSFNSTAGRRSSGPVSSERGEGGYRL